MSASTRNPALNYVVTTVVNGSTSYQLLTFGRGEPEDVVLAEANNVWRGFSFTGDSRLTTGQSQRVDDYRSQTYVYRLSSNPGTWFPWTDIQDTYPHADLAAATASGIGAVVKPYCWHGEKPTERAVLSVVMHQFGED